ncbi:XRE family transcriptional regulator [Orrella dioscoreae]|uniref:XRE family transcriptional regulator n=1 Tax=Orrella dioscoreae TaxID=1851544 RepID=UPI000834B24B|nr:LexA family transcriptional regulator [Orrella dioscoreae]
MLVVKEMSIGERLREKRKEKHLTQGGLARLSGVSQGLIGQIENGINQGSTRLTDIARALGVSAEWLATGQGESSRIPRGAKMVVPEELAPSDVGKIPYWEARGSCGGGFDNNEHMPTGHLVKEYSFFQKYKLNPDNAIAVYADGDSMADFIVEGDIVIFDTSKTEPRSGKIFLIDHPDGLRIKELRREIDGSWVLGSRNADKRRYPDERVDPEHASRLKIHGEFVYRQGG